MRTNVFDTHAGDGRHTNMVKRAREKGRKRRGERNLAARSQPDRGSDHILLSNITLEISLRVGLEEGFGKGRILGVAVKGDDPGVHGSELGQGGSVGHAGRDLLP